MPRLRITNVRAICTAPDGIRLVVVKIETNEPETLRARLRHLHAAAAGGRRGARKLPQAAPDRARPERHRGHLPDLLPELVLADRPDPEQRPLRRRSGALGHQGQAGRDAGLPAARRQGPDGGDRLHPRLWPRRPGGRGARPDADGAGLHAHPRQVEIAGYSTYGAQGGSEPADAGTPVQAHVGHRPTHLEPVQRPWTSRRTCGPCRSCSSTCA